MIVRILLDNSSQFFTVISHVYGSKIHGQNNMKWYFQLWGKKSCLNLLIQFSISTEAINTV